MPTLSRDINIDRREIIRVLGAFTSDELQEMRQDFKDKISGNTHLESESEVGRSSSNVLLQNPTVTLDSIMYVLNRRGQLTKEELTDWISARPKTRVRFIMNPFFRDI